MVHVITTAIYAFLLIMPLATCLWLLASARTIGRQQKKTPKLALTVPPRSPCSSPTSIKDTRAHRKTDLPHLDPKPTATQPHSGTVGAVVPNLVKKKSRPDPIVNNLKPDSLSAMFQAITKDSRDKLFSIAPSSPRDLSPPTLPNKRRHSLGSSPTKQKPKPLSSSPSRPRSNSYTESKSRSSSQLDSAVETVKPDLILPPHTSLEGIHSRILAAYLHLCLRYDSIFVDTQIRAAIITSQTTYLNILRDTGKIDEVTASVCKKHTADSEKELADYTPISKQHKSSAVHNFYRGALLLWVEIVLKREKKPHSSGPSDHELAATFFQTLSDVHQRQHHTQNEASRKPARVCLNAATTMLFENLSALCEHNTEAVKLVTPENIRWAYPLRINQATAELLSHRFKTPDLSNNMAMTTLQSVVDNNFSGLLHNDQHAVMQRVNTDFITEYDGHLSIELVKETLKNLNDHAEYITIDHPDIIELYKTLQFRQQYVYAVRNRTASFVANSLDAQRNGKPDLRKIQYLQKTLRKPTFSTLSAEDQIGILNQADQDLTKMYHGTIPADTLASALQSLRAYAPSISIKRKDTVALSNLCEALADPLLRRDYVIACTQEAACLLTNHYAGRNPTLSYEQLIYLQGIVNSKTLNTLHSDEQAAVLNRVETTLTQKYATIISATKLTAALEQLRTDAPDISIACEEIEKLKQEYGHWMPALNT